MRPIPTPTRLLRLTAVIVLGTTIACTGPDVVPNAAPSTATAAPTATARPMAAPASTATATTAATATPLAATATAQPTPTPARAERVPVIEYHYSTFALSDQTVMHTAWFLRQLDWLKDNGYHTLTDAEFTGYLRGETPVPARSVVLRFDVAQSFFDDYVDVIIPALRERGQHGLFFILASRTSDDCDGVNACWPMLKAWADEGLISPESHSLWHLDYSTLPPEQLVIDAKRSRALIEAKTGHTVHGLCYPFDVVAPAAIDILRDVGYAFAVAGYSRHERGVLFADPDPYALPSIYPYSSDAAYPQLTSHSGYTFESLLETFH